MFLNSYVYPAALFTKWAVRVVGCKYNNNLELLNCRQADLQFLLSHNMIFLFIRCFQNKKCCKEFPVPGRVVSLHGIFPTRDVSFARHGVIGRILYSSL